MVRRSMHIDKIIFIFFSSFCFGNARTFYSPSLSLAFPVYFYTSEIINSQSVGTSKDEQMSYKGRLDQDLWTILKRKTSDHK